MENFCQSCGQTNSAEAQFCRFCASPISPTGTNRQQTKPQNFQGKQMTDAASGRAVGSLVLTVCGLLFCCVLTSVPGAILGWMEVEAIKRGESSPNGMTMAQIGLWGGAAMIVVNLLCYGLLLLMMMMNAGMNEGY